MTQRHLLHLLIAVVVIFACALAFIAGSSFSQARLHASTITLPDKTVVTCISSSSGGVTCSWSTDSVAPKDPKNPTP